MPMPDDLPAGTNVDELLERGDEEELFAVWQTYHGRRIWQLVLDKRDASDEHKANARGYLAELAEVTPLQALRASKRLVELLTGRRWFVMEAAHEAGASWSDIGDALGQTRQAAWNWYKNKIEMQERYVPEFHDAERARAVLDAEPDDHDPTDGTSR